MNESQTQLNIMREYAKSNHVPIMRIDTQKLLIDLVIDAKPKRILEIGTAIGFSGIIMLSYCDATLNTIEMSEVRILQAKENFTKAGLMQRVNFFCGDAKEIVRELTGEYDFIFMDGPKGQYIEFLPYLLDVLTVNGTLVCDNISYMGLTKIADKLPNNHKHITIARNLMRFVKEITSNPNLDSHIFYDNGDGVSVTKKLK